MAMKTTYGSLAYDLDALARERQLDDAGRIPEKKAQVVPAPQSAPRAKAKTRPNLLIVGGTVVLVSLVMVLMLGYVRLTKITADVSAIKSQISQMETEHVSLLTEYERTYDLATVKKVAEEAGMSKPSSGQIEYIDISSGDSAVIYRSAADDAMHNIFTQMKASAGSVLEFFR